jgi:YD repeat-containing protein
LYDELGRARARTGNNGQNVRATYDLNSNLATVTDSLNRVTRYYYDALDRLVETHDAAGGITRFEYNAGDRLTRVIDPRGLITTYVYDGLGQLWAQYSPDTGTTQYQYNASGQLALMTRNDGSQLAYQYDSLGRPTYIGDASWARYYSYDWCSYGKAMLCGLQVNDPYAVHSWTHFGYTPEGRLWVRRDSVSGSDDWTSYAYDGMGRLAGVSYPSGVSVGYGYAWGKLTVMQATINGVTQNVATGIKYQPFGPAAEWTYGNGLHRLMPRDHRPDQ